MLVSNTLPSRHEVKKPPACYYLRKTQPNNMGKLLPLLARGYVIVNTPLPGLYVVPARVLYPDSPGRGVLTDL